MQKLTFIFLILTISGKAQVRFDSLEWQDALQQAKASEKLIFMSAVTDWCEPCEEMQTYVFSDLEVSNFYNRNFINLQVDVEQYPGVELAEMYSIGVYPTFLYVNGTGEVVHRGCGAMDANEFLTLGNSALDEDQNLKYFETQFQSGDRSTNFVMNYLAVLEFACLDVERFAGDFLSTLNENQLTTEMGWAVFASYNWDIFSREFQYLLENQSAFEAVLDPKAVQAKIYDTFLAQYQEVYASEELHDFGMRALLHVINQTSFGGADTLKAMMDLHYAEFEENWEAYAENAIRYVDLTGLNSPEELSELAWQFYLFVEEPSQLEIASNWASTAVEQLPDPSIIDTYASLQFKLGNRNKAIELEEKALELANELYEDTEHFEYQLKRFKEE